MFVTFRKSTRVANFRFINYECWWSTVPLFTTYSDRDYEYIIKDCMPKVCIVSTQEQFNKIKKYLIKDIKVISMDGFDQELIFSKKFLMIGKL